MNNPFSFLKPLREPIVMAVCGILTCLFLFFALQVTTLEQQNKKISFDSKKLEEKVKQLEDENHEITARIEKEKEELKTSYENRKQEDRTLGGELQKTKEALKSLEEEKSYLEDILIHKTKEIEALKKNAVAAPEVSAVVPPKAVQVSTAPTSDFAKKLEEKDKEIAALTERNNILSKKIYAIYKAANDKIAAINMAKITLEETITAAKKSIEGEMNTVDLGSINVDQKQGVKDKPAEAQTPKKEGRILAVNEEHGFVVVDLGKKDGIANDSKFSVRKKNGESIGELSVLEIRDSMTACNIKEVMKNQKIETNDFVLIRK